MQPPIQNQQFHVLYTFFQKRCSSGGKWPIEVHLFYHTGGISMIDFLGKFKKVTHVLAAGAALAIGWAVSDQGQAVIGGIVKAYPKLSGLVGAIGVVAALYHSPKQ
jgi:hypothetical protein